MRRDEVGRKGGRDGIDIVKGKMREGDKRDQKEWELGNECWASWTREREGEARKFWQ